MKRFHETSLSGPVRALALFRIGLGTFAWCAPRTMNRVFGVPRRDDSAALEYMNRVFGVRAVALGAGMLASEPAARSLWLRLWLICDVADTVMGAGMAAQRRFGPVTAAQAMAITGAAAAVDVGALRRGRGRGPAAA